jgi:methylated-DNA-[protein]-cysteine S-methyltransferase
MRIVYHVMAAPQPLGLLLLAAGDRGLRHVDFMDKKSLKRAIAAREAAAPGAQWEPSLQDLRPLADQIDEFLTGARKTLEWQLDPQGDELSIAVWKRLRTVPFGETCTVADLARAIGQPRNLRAVAEAVLTNPLPIVIPCHRVLGADGKPSNYVGGLPRKKYLLELESRFHKLGGLDDNRVIGELTKRVRRPITAARAVVKPAAKKRAGSTTRSAGSTTAVTASLKAPKKRPR